MKPAKVWQIRVQRKIEDWVTVEASSKEEAELKASQLPGIVNVFTGLSMRGDKPAGTSIPKQHLEGDEDE